MILLCLPPKWWDYGMYHIWLKFVFILSSLSSLTPIPSPPNSFALFVVLGIKLWASHIC